MPYVKPLGRGRRECDVTRTDGRFLTAAGFFLIRAGAIYLHNAQLPTRKLGKLESRCLDPKNVRIYMTKRRHRPWPPVRASVRPLVRPLVRSAAVRPPSARPCVRSLTRRSVRPPAHPRARPSAVRPPARSPARPSARPSVHPSARSRARPPTNDWTRISNASYIMFEQIPTAPKTMKLEKEIRVMSH